MRTALFYIATMALVTFITAVAVLWCHLSHIRVGEGRVLIHLWGTHGLHVFDLAILGLELLLLAVLSATLILGFSRDR